MDKEYTLISITHNGRKGVRGTSVDNPKYDGMVGQKVIFDLDAINQFQPMTLKFIEPSAPYSWWYTSEVLALADDTLKKNIILETANTIYTFLYTK